MKFLKEKNEGISSTTKACAAMVGILVLGVIISLVFSGCGKKEAAALEEDVYEDLAPDADEEFELPEMSAHADDDGANFVAGVEAESYSSEPYEADSADVPEDAMLDESDDGYDSYSDEDYAGGSYADDPYGMYLVSEEWAAENGGVFLYRDGLYYAMDGIVPRSSADRFGVGYSIGSSANTENVRLFLQDDHKSGVSEWIPTDTRNGTVFAGDFPTIQVGRGDTVICIYENVMDAYSLYKTELVGYTIEAADLTGERYMPVENGVFYTELPPRSNVGVYDINDNPVEDVRNLTQNETYVYEWFEGTTYKELRMPAVCKCFKAPEKGSEPDYRAPVELTKFGYATIDLSDVAPGIYAVGRYGAAIIEVVD